MISTLHIKNIGIIDDLIIDLNEGLNVLTGETGAGKTLIVGALGIIAGGRFSKDMIRKGETHSFVEASIYCPQNQNSIDGNIIVSREVFLNGRNTCKINGRLATVNELKELMRNIIDIHGQQDNQNLLDSSKHIGYLDSFIGERIEEKRKQYSVLFEKYNEIHHELNQNYGDDKERQRKLDLLQYQLNEIEKANLKVGEEDELQEKHLLMKNSEKLQENLKSIDESLNMQAIEGVSNSIKCLEKIENCGEIYSEKLAELKNIYYEIQELSRDICGMQDDIYFNEYDRDKVERRLDEIFSLKRKYGNSIEEILNYQKELETEINQIENLEEINGKLKQEVRKVEKQMTLLCEEMNTLRCQYASELSLKINKELKELEMPHSVFHVNVEKTETGVFNVYGANKVDFRICTNTGEEEKPLIKVASGGEMSRVMLAIKTVLANVDEVPTLIFDEIDTGISGKAAKAVAEKMKIIAKNHQIICITHLPSIAAKGDYNYYISKNIQNEKTVTNIRLLSEEETISEIARIANGDITEVAIANARELRKAG